MGKVYREFSRQMYNKFKHQFPKMRESEIVRKIIKDWEGLSYLQKEALNDRYAATNSLKDEEMGSPYVKKSYQISDTGAKTASPMPNKNFKTNVFPPLFPAKPEYDNDSDYNRYSERPSEDQKSDRSSYSVALHKKALSPISKKERYSNFYKYHYSKLAQEHPKWTSREISHIVKLQWKDLQKKSKESSKRKLTKTKIIRRLISGMSWFFVKSRKNGIPLREARKNWRKLPLESKKLYAWRAAGKNPEDRSNKTIVQVYRCRNVLMLK